VNRQGEGEYIRREVGLAQTNLPGIRSNELHEENGFESSFSKERRVQKGKQNCSEELEVDWRDGPEPTSFGRRQQTNPDRYNKDWTKRVEKKR
jgi:hypothetical protein